MDLSRRGFLKSSALAAGAAGLGGATRVCCGGQSAQPRTTIAALTVNGKLVQAPHDPRDGTPGHDTDAAGDHVMPPGHGLPPTDPAVRRGIVGRKFVMVIDLARCDGCGACQTACSKMHFIPPTRQYIKVLRMQDAEQAAPYFFPQPCYQCDNPPCTKVCPVDATFKREDGIVLIDNQRCIGCRFCMAACPYGARSFNWGKPEDPPAVQGQAYSPEHGFPRAMGTVEKCDFCPDMAAEGKLPPCAGVCPMGAIYYGDQNEDAVTNGVGETARLSDLLRDNAGYRHMEELNTQPRVWYLPPRNRKYAPPAAPAKSAAEPGKSASPHDHAGAEKPHAH